MISFDLHISPRMIKRNVYTISPSSKAHSFFKNEYPNNNEDFAYLIPETKPRIIKRIFRKDFSVKIPLGTPEHLYFKSEYGSLIEDYEHNLIVPEEEFNNIRRR